MRPGLQESISLPLVFIDGITRSGKSAFSGILPSLRNMEHVQFCNQLELIVPGLSLGLVDRGFAKAFLRIYFNELSYNLQLSRNVNFRPGDQTGVPNFSEPELYRERLTHPEGEAAVAACRRRERQVPVVSHDLMVNMDVIEELGLDFRMLLLWRNPVDNIYSWWTRGWGERYNGDPRGFTLLLDGGDELYPWYVNGFADELRGLNPMEKCIRIATDLLERAVAQHRRMPSKDRVHMLTFEQVCADPHAEIGRICAFLGTEVTEHTDRFVAAARFPRTLKRDDLDRKREEFKAGVRPALYERLVENERGYLDGVYGLMA